MFKSNKKLVSVKKIGLDIAEMKQGVHPLLLIGIIISMLFCIAICIGFGLNAKNTNEYVATLKTTIDTLQATLVNTQNGTCVMGFPKTPQTNQLPTSASDFTDYINITYVLDDILQAGVPSSVVTFGQTSRPIVFNAYNPALTQPNYNDLIMYVGFCNPPITFLNNKAFLNELVSFPQTTASYIKLTPDCVSPSSNARNGSYCVQEQGYWTRSLSNPFYNNTFIVIPVYSNGDTLMKFIWGQWAYGSLGAQYNFSGTTIEFTSPLVMSI